MGSLPLMEMFYSLQGEGFHTGRAAFFIRLAGCDVGCVWCDVKESWNASAHPLTDVNAIVQQAKKHPCPFVVITGGEPCMYQLDTLTTSLKSDGFEIALETSGAYPITGTFDWICVSPKKFKAPLEENLKMADELKCIIFNQSDFLWAEKNAALTKPGCRLFIQPEYEVRSKVLPLMIRYIQSHPQWRMSLQTHKMMNIP